MNKSIIQYLAVGWIGTMGLGNLNQTALAGEPGPAPQITVYVYNWAQVEPNTLREAREVATRIFRNAGVEAVLRDHRLPSENEQMDAVEQPLQHPTFYVHIVPPAMAKHFRLPGTMLGLAPGTPEERDRKTVYVFDHVAARMAQEHQEQVLARVNGTSSRHGDKGHILGHGMVHEIGHVLLHMESHSPQGIMQASWDRGAMQDMAAGTLTFSREEVERIQAEVARRTGQSF